MKHLESFESNRWIWRVNFALQLVLVFALLAVVNFIGMLVWTRFDLTKNRAYSLSGEARSYVKALEKPVHVIVTLPEGSDKEGIDQAYRDVRGLLREFEFASRENKKGPITVEFLNVDQNRARAEALQLQGQAEAVIFDSNDPVALDTYENARRRHVITVGDLYVRQGGDRSQFVGERAFASALLDVTSDKRPTLYFLTGHGEMRLDDIDPGRGASRLDAKLKAAAYETQELDLSATRRIPDDGDRRSMIFVLSPQAPLQRSEQELLREYLTRRAGRVFLALDPRRNHGLDDLLFEWGVLVDDVLVVETSSNSRTDANELLVRGIAADHPITRSLVEKKLPLVIGAARSVRPDPGRPLDDSLVVTHLLWTSAGVLRNQPTSWGEFNYRQAGTVRFDQGRDLLGPIDLATVAERKVDESLKIKLPGGRLIVCGSSDFLGNNRIDVLGNFGLVYHSVNWALDLEHRVDIPPRPIERLKLTLSEHQLRVSGFAIVLGLPLCVTVFGLAVFFARRR